MALDSAKHSTDALRGFLDRRLSYFGDEVAAVRRDSLFTLLDGMMPAKRPSVTTLAEVGEVNLDSPMMGSFDGGRRDSLVSLIDGFLNARRPSMNLIEEECPYYAPSTPSTRAPTTPRLGVPALSGQSYWSTTSIEASSEASESFPPTPRTEDISLDLYNLSLQNRSTKTSSIKKPLEPPAGLHRELLDAPLRPVGQKVGHAPIGDLWQDKPALVFVVRRSGCPLCRAQALLISHSRHLLKRLGYATIAIFNTENTDNKEFAKHYWNGQAYVSDDKTLLFHKAVGGGTVQKANPLKESLSPAFAKRIFRAMATNKALPGFSNKTAGPVLGGMMLFLPGTEGIAFLQSEESLGNFGDFAKMLRMAWLHSVHRDEVPYEEVQEAIDEHIERVSRSLPKIRNPAKPAPFMLRR